METIVVSIGDPERDPDLAEAISDHVRLEEYDIEYVYALTRLLGGGADETFDYWLNRMDEVGGQHDYIFPSSQL